jgi:decaprenyl-phosphate phosphoribosyltransferase
VSAGCTARGAVLWSRAMIVGLLRTMRPKQWVKNTFVLFPVVFARDLFDQHRAVSALAGFGCFCLCASAVYVLNDLVDVEADRAHAVKKNRPIASGSVSPTAAKIALAVLATSALGAGWLISPWFAACLAGYLAKDILYSIGGLKKIAYVDVLLIAAGFELRVLAGAFAADVPASAYLLIVTFLLAMFLGLGKRMHELLQQERSGSSTTRKVLEAYSKGTITALLWITGIATFATYVVYTLDPGTRAQFGTDYLGFSSPFALFGLLRFIHLVRNRPDSESPTEEILKDIPFIANAVIWGAAVLAIIYFL